MAGRAHLAGKDIGQRRAALFPELAHVNDGADAVDVLHIGKVHGTADVDDKDHVLIVLGAEADHGHFFRQEHEFFRFAIGTFAGLAGQDIDTGVCAAVRDIFFRHGAAGRINEAFAKDIVGVGPAADTEEPFPHFLKESLLLGLEVRFIVIQPAFGRDRKAGGLKAFQHIHIAAGVHFSAAGAAENGFRGARAVKGDISLL